MGNRKRTQMYTKFLMYVVVVVLINLVGLTLFFRLDLTRSDKYSLSEASRQVLSDISDPLTIKVFFTRNLPAPHNTTERYLHDLLEEYALYADENFNYQFYNVTPQDGEESPQVLENQGLAKDYGVYPVQVQNIEADEVKFKQAYMGLVIIHGDLTETIDTVDSTEGLEYRITASIRKLADKISAFAGLQENIRVQLVLSSSLFAVAPYMGIQNLRQLPETIKEIVADINRKLSDRLTLETLDPTQTSRSISDFAETNLVRLQWPEIPRKSGRPIPAGEGVAGIVLTYQGKTDSLPALHVVDIPIFGTQYSLPEAAAMKETLHEKIESLVGINDDVGYLADHGTLDAVTPNTFPRQQQSAEESLMNFRLQLAENYTLDPVSLRESDHLQETFNCLIIARPTEPFSDYELFQIDQYLMRGNNLALFLDPFQETYPEGVPSAYRQPVYKPVDTGLEKLLHHYGVKLEKAVVMDEVCFTQRRDSRRGGGEQPIYFAPVIKNEFINNESEFMNNIKGLITMKTGPVALLKETLEKNGLSGTALFSSSDLSWKKTGRISFNPIFIQPPGPGEERRSFPLACMIEGEFPSYFAGKEIPVKKEEAADEQPQDGDNSGEKKGEKTAVKARDRIIPRGKSAKIFVTASSQMLRDHMFDREGRHPNSIFVMNLLDSLNNRDDMAVLRSKQQAYNPLRNLSAPTKAAIKWFNIAGLPVMVIVFGLVVLLFRINRKRRLRIMFSR